MISHEPHRQTGNRFIDALPDDVSAAIAQAADLRTWAEGAALGRRGERVRTVDFPLSGAIAHLEQQGNAMPIEIATVDTAGVSAFETLFGVRTAQFTRVAPVPLAAFSVDARVLQRIFDGSPEFRALLQRYAVAAIRLAGLRAACDRHHLLDRRLASWLLALYRASRARELRVTHGLAARMLGAQRAGITRAYASVAATGAIRYERGRLRVRDPERLAAACCRCPEASRTVLDAVYA